MNDWLLYVGVYVVLIVWITVTWKLSVRQAIVIALVPVAWPIILPVVLLQRWFKTRAGGDVPQGGPDGGPR